MLKRWRASPLPRWGYLAGRTCATALMALASAAVTVLVGVLAYHAQLNAGAVLSLLVALVLGALAWASVGTAVTAVITLLGYLPGRPTVDAVTGALGTTGGRPSLPGHDLAILVAWAAAALLVSLRLFRWEPRASR